MPDLTMAGGAEIKEEYTSSLADLTFNSKPLISVLTILAEENVAHAKEIVEAIETHLSRVRLEVKLPVLYLIDCIIKNVGGAYTGLFCQNIVSTFCSVFEKVDERTRSEMFRLRQTWSDVIPQKKLYALDVQIKQLDPAWPLTAPPPPIGIHLNPKFFMPTTTSADKTTPQPIITNAQTSLRKGSSANADVDPKTLLMQQKIINKQRELLELQQKKVQLELLQTQVKLQEQLKNTQVPNSTPNMPVHSRNVLLKPEVAKQQMVSGQSSKGTSSKSRSGTHTKVTPRIAPVQNNLINARPVRDPRLLRQLQQAQPVLQPNPTTNDDFKSKPEPQQVLDADNNKIVNNKTNVRNEHRLVDNNKGNHFESHGKSKNLPYPSSPKHTQKISGTSRTKTRFSRDAKTVSSALAELNEVKHDLTDSTKTSKSDVSERKQNIFKMKFKKKPVTSDKELVDQPSDLYMSHKGSDKKGARFIKNSDKRVKDSKSVFKDFKSTAKNRDHIRRPRVTTPSPEGEHDVDLRIEAVADKITSVKNDKHFSPENQIPIDVGLRHQPTSKKRSSTDNNCDSPAKKTKSQMFDVLFGSEDTDLRQQLPAVDTRPPTPPPAPIISTEDSAQPKHIENEAPTKSNSNLDALRVKLANAMNQDKEDQEKNANMLTPPKKQNSRENLNTQILISPADQMGIKEGTMTEAQKTALMGKILAQMETHQLREAQRRESETLNSTFQPISDDELEMNLSDEDSQTRGSNLQANNDNAIIKEDRPPELPSFGDFQDDFATFSHNTDYRERDPRRGRPWRNGRNRQKHWDAGPPARVALRQNFRPPIDPWLHPSQLPPPPPPAVNMTAFLPPPTVDIPPLVFSHPDTYKFITIDNEPREIRYYDDTAIVFLSSNEPREINFHNGSRCIYFDNEPHILHFNSPYVEILIKGNRHQVKLGGPSREICIDGNGYECYFDQKEKLIELDGNCIVVKLEPPPPQVKIGEKRLDLVAGKTQLIVDAKNMFTVFLDSKLQTFKVDNVEHTLKFVDSLRAVLLDDVRFEIEFGGLPKPLILNDRKYFIRFSVLPKGIKAGYVNIKDMEVTDVYKSSVIERDEVTMENTNSQTERTGSPGQFVSQNCDNLDVLSNAIAKSMISSERDGGSYSVEDTTPSESQNELVHNIPTVKPETKEVININDLFQRLVATGIVGMAMEEPETKPLPEVKIEEYKPPQQDYKPIEYNPVEFKPPRGFLRNTQEFKPPSFSKPESLKIRRTGVVDLMYVGQQCSSCGVRFSHRLDNYYKQHLDWHFRQNRKGRKSNRLSACRRWYYSSSDWRNYEEIEDLEERGKSYFENQAGTVNNEPEEEEIEIPCITADPDVTDPVCEVCLERLEQFYNEDKEEWQLRMAIRVDDKIYHPLCYDDYQASLIEITLNTDIQDIPGLDGVEEAPSPEPNDIDDVMEVIENIDDEVEQPPEVQTPDEHAYKIIEENNLIEDDSDDADDDVIINEVIPERIIVDDDKEDDYVPPSPSKIPINPPIVIKEEPIDDGFVDIEGGLVKAQTTLVKIKTEPVDIDEANKEEETTGDASDTTHIEVVSSIDGNFELDSIRSEASSVPQPSITAGKIKINITKPIPTVITKELHESINETSINPPNYVDPNEPLPPGEEPVLLNIKPALQGVQLKRNPVVRKGSELTGLCSIM